jgi:uncharacterized iron-regulated membrane protein
MKRRSQPTSARSISPIADKPLLLRLHRWSGLAIAVVVLCVGLTGALTTWQQEIDAWLNPDLLQVEPAAGPTQSLDHLVDVAAATRPGLDVSGVRLPQSAGDSVEVSVAPRSAGVFAGWYVYVDPHDARVLGSRPFDPDPWSRRGVVASLYEFHYSLAASRAGVWAVTIAAALWIVTSLLGVWLAWPKSMHGWRRAFRVRFHGSTARINRDLHRSTGLLTAAFVVTVLATGILLNLAPQTAAIVQRFSPLTSEPTLPARPMTNARRVVGWQGAVEAARRARHGSVPFTIYLDAERDLYVVRMREPDAIHRRGQTRVYVDAGSCVDASNCADASNATVLAVWNPRLGSAGDRFMCWQNPLHSGYAFGAVGRALVFLSGVAPMLFVVTGVPLWYARRRVRTRR